VISIAPIAFFTLVLSLGLYLCMVLIGRRHWSGGKDGNTMFLHYAGRILLLVRDRLLAQLFLKE
jgi:ABC-2 type transport system permease protein